MSEDTREYLPTPEESALWDWITDALDGFEGVSVYFALQGNVRLPKPFVTIQVLTDMEESDPIQQLTGEVLEDGSHQVETVEWRTATVQITAFGRDSRSIMRAVERSIGREDIVSRNSGRGVEIREAVGSIMNLSAMMSTVGESRHQQDYRFAYASCTVEASGIRVLERVVASGDVGTLPATFTETWPEG